MSDGKYPGGWAENLRLEDFVFKADTDWRDERLVVEPKRDADGSPRMNVDVPRQSGKTAAYESVSAESAAKLRVAFPRIMEAMDTLKTLAEEPYASVIAHLARGGVVKCLTHDEAVADADAFRESLRSDPGFKVED